jgi:hypothetical protein
MNKPYRALLIAVIALPVLTAGSAGASALARSNVSLPEHEVMDVIETMFDGMRTGDADMVASTFAEGAMLTSSGSRGGMPFTQSTPATQFVGAIRQSAGSGNWLPWDERIWNVEIHVRDNLASAWMDYAFFHGEDFSHCGVNTFQLARQADGAWKTVAIADTRTPGPDCDLDADAVEESAVRVPLRNYLRGHATGDGSYHEMAFDPVANLYWITDDGLMQRTSEEYIAGASGQPAADENERSRYIEWVDVDGSAATAKIILDYPNARFADYMQLLKIDGEWKIVNKIFDVERR